MGTIAVIGSNGQLGTDLVRVFADAGHDLVPLTHDAIEITDRRSVETVLLASACETVVNTAALNVEASERDPSRAFAVNAIACRYLAETAGALGAKLLQIGTDYVFDGEKAEPYSEFDAVRPINNYGISKLAGEFFMLAGSGENCVIRSSGLYGAAGCRAKGGMNFVTTILKLAAGCETLNIVDDEVMSPTYTADLARQILSIHETGMTGVVHATSAGSCSWFEFARAIRELAGTDLRLDATTGAEFAAGAEVPVKRPAFTALENRRLKDAGLHRMPAWRDALARYLVEIGVRAAP